MVDYSKLYLFRVRSFRRSETFAIFEKSVTYTFQFFLNTGGSVCVTNDHIR